MPHLDPTYLRYIYDGLIKGSVHSENSSELPEGLIGLYEEAFEEHLPVLQRQQLLQRFALFALLKKEVSSAFVAEVLKESEDVILEFINTYASWFNSPEPGKFQLYHERLKVYGLQKLSETETLTIHEKLIARLEQAIEEQQADEFERYALEFLSEHLYIDSMLSKDGQKLIDLGYSQSHWQRQLKISKGYTWTKNGLKAVMTWASKFNDYEVIECGLQMVDLHHQEQNSSPQIVAMLSEGDFKNVLNRIEQFGGNSPTGRMRKALLLLCSIAIILLNDKKSCFSNKSELLELIEVFKDQYKINKERIETYFSSILLFRIACELNKRGLDYSFLSNCIGRYDNFWIEMVDIEDSEKSVLKSLMKSGITHESNRENFKSNVKDLEAKDRNRTFSYELDNAFYQIHENHFKADVLAIKRDYMGAIDCFLQSLNFSRFFDARVAGITGETDVKYRQSFLSDCLTQSVNQNNWQTISFLLNTLEPVTPSLVYKILPLVGNTKLAIIRILLRLGMHDEINSILNQLKRQDRYWFQAAITEICIQLIELDQWKYSLEFLSFISVYLFDDRDAIIYLQKYQARFNLNNELSSSKWFRKIFTFRNNQIRDVHLNTVIIINYYLKNEIERKSIIPILLKNLKRVRSDKIIMLLEFFIINIPEEIENASKQAWLRIEREENLMNQIVFLFETIALFEKHELANYSKIFREKLEEKHIHCSDEELIEKIIVYFPFSNYSLEQLIINFLNNEQRLMLSWNGYIRWNECLFNLVNISIQEETDDWIQLIKFHVENRTRIQEPLSFTGNVIDAAKKLCMKKNYEAAELFANLIPESECVLEEILSSYLINKEYDKFFESSQNFKGLKIADISKLVTKYIWSIDEVDLNLLKKFSTFISFANMKFHTGSIAKIPYLQLVKYLKLINTENIDLMEMILAKYSVDRILIKKCDDQLFNHLNKTLNLSWYKQIVN